VKAVAIFSLFHSQSFPQVSGVASPKIWEGQKNGGGAKCSILGE